LGSDAGIDVIIVDPTTFENGGRTDPGSPWRRAFEDAVQDSNSIGVIFIGHTEASGEADIMRIGPNADTAYHAGALMFNEKDGGNFSASNSTLQTPGAGLIGLFGCNSKDLANLFTNGSSSVISVDGGRDGLTHLNTMSYAAYATARTLIQGGNATSAFNAANSAFIKSSGSIRVGNNVISRGGDFVGDKVVRNK
jgi:hypothetical protein